VVGAQPGQGRVVVAQLAPRVWPQRSSPTGIWRGSDDADSHKWVPNVGSSYKAVRKVSPTLATDHSWCVEGGVSSQHPG